MVNGVLHRFVKERIKKLKYLKNFTFLIQLVFYTVPLLTYLGFRVNSGEYKLMGLAPYGIENSDETNIFIDKIKSEIVDIKEDGSIFLNQKYFKYTYGLRMIKEKSLNLYLDLILEKKRKKSHKLIVIWL